MSREQTSSELSDLLAQAREYLRYYEELGAETVAADFSQPVPSPAASGPAIEELPKNSVTPAPTVARVAPTPAAAKTTISPLPRTAPAPPQGLFGESAAPAPSLPRSTEILEDIWQDIGDCTRCALCSGRTQVVNTHGNPKARLMFVGEAPGADEDAQGKPFVGRAGQLLTKMIEAMGWKREEVIIGNVNRCRPPGNRQPTLEEAAICRPFLYREIAVIRPDVIVVMGNTALRNLLEIKAGISSVRGRFQDYQGIKVMPTFHPAYLLRDPSKKRETWDDLKKVMEYLDRGSSNAAGV
jgi:DNA polymerase